MKSILITGANGFIGSYLVEEALRRGYKVFAGVRPNSNRAYLTDPRIIFFETELFDKKMLTEKLNSFKTKNGKFDYVIHNAGITKTCSKSDFEIINYKYTRNIIEALQETDSIAGKFIYMSSLAAYGPGNEKTMQPVKDTDIPHPITLYGESKLKSERYIKSLSNFPYLIFRPTGTYGYREKDFLIVYQNIKKGIETYVGSTNQQLTFIYVKDLTRVIFDAIESSISCKSYFVTDLKKYTVKEFNGIIKRILNKKTIQIVFPAAIVKTLAFINEKLFCLIGKPPTLNTDKYNEISRKNWLCDSNSLVEDFGFVPEYDLLKGLNETIKQYKKDNLL